MKIDVQTLIQNIQERNVVVNTNTGKDWLDFTVGWLDFTVEVKEYVELLVYVGIFPFWRTVRLYNMLEADTLVDISFKDTYRLVKALQRERFLVNQENTAARKQRINQQIDEFNAGMRAKLLNQEPKQDA